MEREFFIRFAQTMLTMPESNTLPGLVSSAFVLHKIPRQNSSDYIYALHKQRIPAGIEKKTVNSEKLIRFIYKK